MEKASQLIIGIDPGSTVTGYGLIESNGRESRYLTSGCINLHKIPFNQRLGKIFDEINKLINFYKPQRAAIEQVFLHHNASSALKLGLARGAAITAIVTNNIQLAEYSARQVKKAVVGYGAAEKNQVNYMVRALLKLNYPIAADAADALAIAIYDAHHLTSIKASA